MKKILNILIVFLVPFFVLLSTNLYADEKSILLGQKLWKKSLKCGYCHGPFGNGSGDPRSPGKAANLRVTQLDKDGLMEIIACGIPGTEMPYFHRSAYKKPEICWDTLAEDLGEDMPKKGKKMISDKSVIAIADYIIARLKGRGDITAAECEEYFSVGSKRCEGFRQKEQEQ
tara:strand:- start:102 stop:617 length:516 start_codon:yes stop_codon:yes gene_type:complete